MKREIKKPRHIGIILDGNGRWAKNRHMPRLVGHKAGVLAIAKTIKAAIEEGIEILSVFAFSTENWKRSREEVDGIFALISQAIDRYKEEIIKKEIKVQILGDYSVLEDDLKRKIDEIIDETKNNKKLIFNIVLNYGSRAEILKAVNACSQKYPGQTITEEMFEKELYTSGLPDVDFIIRTSGEQRISNFMLYQSAYAEFYFPKVFWPDFNAKFLKKALKVYSKRNRRFGKVWDFFLKIILIVINWF